MSRIPELPEAGRRVVQGVIPSLHFVLQYWGALSEGEPQQVITDDHHRDPRRANVLLRTSKNHTKLKTRKACHFRCTWLFFTNVFQLTNFFPKYNFYEEVTILFLFEMHFFLYKVSIWEQNRYSWVQRLVDYVCLVLLQFKGLAKAYHCKYLIHIHIHSAYFLSISKLVFKIGRLTVLGNQKTQNF